MRTPKKRRPALSHLPLRHRGAGQPSRAPQPGESSPVGPRGGNRSQASESLKSLQRGKFKIHVLDGWSNTGRVKDLEQLPTLNAL